MTDDLTRNIKTALADRRPGPSRDLAGRLAAAAARRRARPRFVVPAVLALSVAALALVVLATRPTETGDDRHDVALPAGGSNATQPAGPALDPDRLPAYQALLDDTSSTMSPKHPDTQGKECMSCHEHASVHDKKFTNQQCLNCHIVPNNSTAQHDKIHDAALELARQRALHLERKRVAELELRKVLAVAEPDLTKVAAAFDVVAAEDTALARAELVARLTARAALDPAQRAEIERGKTPPAPALATLEVRSVTPGRVEIDGKAVGNSPVRVELAPGKHLVRIDAAGHESATKTVDLGGGSRTVLDLEPGMQPHAGTGVLYVMASPYATVVIDGKQVGDTPVKVTLSAGKHKVSLSSSNGNKQTRVVTIEEGKTAKIDADIDTDPFTNPFDRR